MKSNFVRLMEKAKILGKDDCWNWKGSKSKDGRCGNFRHKGKTYLAHRVAFEILVKDIPSGLNVCHRCDNSLCINPNHLFLGTQKDNIHDMMKKGRGVSLAGEGCGASKLTEKKVSKIRILLNKGFSTYSIAPKFNVSPQAIFDIKRKRTWKHNPPPQTT